MRNTALFLLLILTVSLSFALGCGDSSPAKPVSGGELNIDTVWPNENGRAWEFWARVGEDVTGSAADSLAPWVTPVDSIAPAFTLEEVIQFVKNPPAFTPDQLGEGTMNYKFLGTDTTDTGVEGQNLVSFEGENAAPVLEQVPSLSFARSLAKARPDLAARLDGIMDLSQDEEDVGLDAILLHGGIFDKDAERIGTYSDVDMNLGWKFLEDDFTPGAQFTFQLIPAITDNVFLKAVVFEVGTVKTSLGEHENAVEVIYTVDYGATSVVGEDSPASQGNIRYALIGHVVYAPQVGPIMSWERDLIPMGSQPHPGLAEREQDISTVTAGPEPEPAS